MSKKNKLLLIIVCLSIICTAVLYIKHVLVLKDLDIVNSRIIADEEEVE